jgi:hypothetical protein
MWYWNPPLSECIPPKHSKGEFGLGSILVWQFLLDFQFFHLVFSFLKCVNIRIHSKHIGKCHLLLQITIFYTQKEMWWNWSEEFPRCCKLLKWQYCELFWVPLAILL